MIDASRTIELSGIPDSWLSQLDNRDIALWVQEDAVDESEVAIIAEAMKLPWRMVLSESSNSCLCRILQESEEAVDPMVRIRGFVQLIDNNPADIVLPPRCLPIYLLNGLAPRTAARGITARARRLNMLSSLASSGVRNLVVISGSGGALPQDIHDLWEDGFHVYVTVVSQEHGVPDELEAWRQSRTSGGSVAYYPVSVREFCRELTEIYSGGTDAGKLIIRIRDVRGEYDNLDVYEVDDPERPILANYDLIQEKHLRRQVDLSAEDIYGFFHDPASSWRAFAADLPWFHNDEPWLRLLAILRKMDRRGPDAARIGYISAEPGSGGTTLLRALAWRAAERGYPTLIAAAAPFLPSALHVANFMMRVADKQRETSSSAGERLYETPWLLAFDKQWEGREDEVRLFLRELQRSGRPACILLVTGPYTNPWREAPLAVCNHQISEEQALDLGRHVNQFLRPHGTDRSANEWRDFYAGTSVVENVASFWISLSFWLHRQFDMRETVQSWIYRQYKENIKDSAVRAAVLDIAVLSSERRPLPETLLPPTTDWPVSLKIEDVRKEIPGIGLVRVTRDFDKYWATCHTVIGRFIVTAMFYDVEERDRAGFAHAQDPEHLRFLVLRRISRSTALADRRHRAIAEEFATTIFKLDPERGHSNFMLYWREVLDALDDMPPLLRDSSRAFRHHTAVSRRRVAKQKDHFVTTSDERVKLLHRAVADIRYALENIPASAGEENDLNLYNSLALAYLDLAEEEAERGADGDVVEGFRLQAHEATQRVYRIDPDNSFVVETYARSLLSEGRAVHAMAAENAIEVLNVVYAAMERDSSARRHHRLGELADQAIELLADVAPGDSAAGRQPETAVEAIALAIRALVRGVKPPHHFDLSQLPAANRLEAASLLSVPVLVGNPQAVRLLYALSCLNEPYNFRRQLELLQALQGDGVLFTPQMRLELAVLLQQCDRHHEANRLFHQLRRLWQQGQHFAEVPRRLKWLLSINGARRQVTAQVAQRREFRHAARVRELQNTEVPFRSQEFGQENFRAGAVIRGYITFGHNGPFLRPLTSAQR